MLCPTTSLATGPTCDEVLGKCAKAVEAQERQIQLCDLALNIAVDQNAQLNLRVKELEESNQSIFKNPAVMIALGVVVGAVVVGVAK